MFSAIIILVLLLQGTPPPAGTLAQEPEPPAPPADQFHPDRARPATARPGGSIRVHITSSPATLNYDLSMGDSNCYLIHEELSDRLAVMDWTTRRMEPRLARSWTIEDVVVLEEDPPPPRRDPETGSVDQAALHAWRKLMSPEAFLARRLIGRVEEKGDRIRLTPLSSQNPLKEPVELDRGKIVRIDRAMAFTIDLRHDVTWHDGERFTAHDVEFSWSIVRNPYVDTAFMRDYYDLMHYCRALDDFTVRMVYGSQYFEAKIFALEALFLVPRHLYELPDAESIDDPEERLERQAGFIRKQRANTHWVGLGPYRLEGWDPDHYIDLVRFGGYWGPRPYLDRIRYKVIGSRQLAYQAVKAGELDFAPRIEPADYYDDAPASPAADGLVRALYYYPSYTFVAWNTHHPALRERAVRQALALAFDRETFFRTHARGEGHMVTGDQYYFGPGYDHSIEPWPYDPDRAVKLLEESGWYDRDGDGVRDKGGVPLAFELLYPSSSDLAPRLALEMQQAYDSIGVRMTTSSLEWAVFLERLTGKHFDASPLSWNMDPESDPHQVWHSSGASFEARGSNYTSFANPEADRLIDQGRRTIDDRQRWSIWRQLHALLHIEQPVMFLAISPQRAVYHRRYRGVRFYRSRPGFSLREWFVAESGGESNH